MSRFWSRATRRKASLILMSAGSLFDISGQSALEHFESRMGREIRPDTRNGFAQDRANIAKDWERVVKRVVAAGTVEERSAPNE